MAKNIDDINAVVARVIERQELAGQRALAETSMIPKEIFGATREQLSAMGFKFGGDIDELFVACELPRGWTKRGMDHSMHTELLDEQGRSRGGIFYKSSSYDRRAHIFVHRRFRIDPYGQGSQVGYARCVAMDGDAVVYDAGERKLYDDTGQSDLLYAACTKWLDEAYPEWQSPLAYW